MQKEIELCKALIIIAEFLNQTESNVIMNLTIFGTDKQSLIKIKNAIDLFNNFNNKTLEEKIKTMGYNYKYKENKVIEISTK